MRACVVRTNKCGRGRRRRRTCMTGGVRTNILRLKNRLTRGLDIIYPVFFHLVVDPSVGNQVSGASIYLFCEIISTWIEKMVPAVLGGRTWFLNFYLGRQELC